MKIPRASHRWHVTPQQAVVIQTRLAATVRHARLRKKIRYIAGVDASFLPDGTRCLAAAVLWDLEEQRVLEQHIARRPITFPYVPGLLSFREAPTVLAALRKLHGNPDVIVCDAHGYAHPRRFGLACHVGVICDRPTIGCAKSVLIGAYRAPAERRGSRTPLIDREERVGTVLRTRSGVKAVFVSAGHLIDLSSAERLVLECAIRYRLPEPTRLADKVAAEARRAARE